MASDKQNSTTEEDLKRLLELKQIPDSQLTKKQQLKMDKLHEQHQTYVRLNSSEMNKKLQNKPEALMLTVQSSASSALMAYDYKNNFANKPSYQKPTSEKEKGVKTIKFDNVQEATDFLQSQASKGRKFKVMNSANHVLAVSNGKGLLQHSNGRPLKTTSLANTMQNNDAQTKGMQGNTGQNSVVQNNRMENTAMQSNGPGNRNVQNRAMQRSPEKFSAMQNNAEHYRAMQITPSMNSVAQNNIMEVNALQNNAPGNRNVQIKAMEDNPERFSAMQNNAEHYRAMQTNPGMNSIAQNNIMEVNALQNNAPGNRNVQIKAMEDNPVQKASRPNMSAPLSTESMKLGSAVTGKSSNKLTPKLEEEAPLEVEYKSPKPDPFKKSPYDK